MAVYCVQNLTLPWQPHFDRSAFANSYFFVFLLMKIYSNAALFIFLGLFAPFYSFWILFSKFWRFFRLGNISKSKLTSVWNSRRNCHVTWCHRHTWRTSQVWFLDVLYTLYIATLIFWKLRSGGCPPTPLSPCLKRSKKYPIWIGLMTLM